MERTKNLLLASGFWLLASGLSAQPCKVKPIVKNCMASLAPYQYDGYLVQKIVYGPKAKKESIKFAVYSGEEYKCKWVFGKTVLPLEVGITIYDGNPKTKGKIVFIDESGTKDNFVCNFLPTKTGTYYIEYEIPAATAPNQKGCFVMLIGILE